jgi:hypothetical protein
MGDEAMSNLFGVPDLQAMKKKGWANLSRTRVQIERLQKKVHEGEASVEEMERLGDLSQLLARNEREAFEKWRKAFGR